MAPEFCLPVREGDRAVRLCWPNDFDHQYQQVRKFGRFYEFRFLRYIGAVGRLRRFRSCFDIGTCFGNHAVYFGAIMGCQVTCFEPNDALIGVIEHNLQSAGVDHTIQNVALGQVEGSGAMAIKPGNMGASSFVESGLEAGAGGTRICPLDAYAVEASLPDPDFVKIDAEGFEQAILRGAQAFLARVGPDIFIEIWPDNDAECSALLRALGYRRVVGFGKNFHYSRTVTLAQRLLLLISAAVVAIQTEWIVLTQPAAGPAK